MKYKKNISIEEIKELLKTRNISFVCRIVNNREDLKEQVYSLTFFLSESSSTQQRLWHIKENIFSVPKCENEHCNNFVSFKNSVAGYRKYCSRTCSGSDKSLQLKIEETNLKKYGVKRPLQNSTIKAKVKLINSNKSYEEKTSEIEKYRVSRLKISNEKYTETLLKNNLLLLDTFSGIGHSYNFKCLKCNTVFTHVLQPSHLPICRACNPINSIYYSKYEDEIYNWLGSLNIKNIIKNDRNLLYPKEIDIYLPEYSLGIEFDGLWSHSEFAGGKTRSYHLNKTEACKKLGVQLIHIFEDEWLNKQEIVKSIILSKLGLIKNKVYARDCSVKEINDDTIIHEFYTKNHLQGYSSGKYAFGLYDKGGTLVYMVSLKSPRFNKHFQYEVLRSCSKINTVVIGGFSKILSYAEKTLGISSLISYVDQRYFSGSSYSNWKFLYASDPSYYYINKKDPSFRENRLTYQKHKLKELFPSEFNGDLSESENMRNFGYDRIYDCGTLVFTKNNENK